MADYKFTQESGADWKVSTADKADAIEDSNELRAIVDELGRLLGHSKKDGAFPKDGTSGGTIYVKKSKIDATAAPAVTNDTTEGYAVNSLWIDVTNDKAYICVDATDGAAVWIEITSQGVGDALTTDPLSQFAATTSAELAGVISDEKGAGALVFETLLAKLFPNIYNRDIKWLLKEPYTTAANRYTIQTPNDMSVDIDGAIYFIETQSDIDLSVEANWDTIAVDYRVAATRAGKVFLHLRLPTCFRGRTCH